MNETNELITTKLHVTAASDPSRVGNVVFLHSNGEQAVIQDANGTVLVDWTKDVRFGETTVLEKRVPSWAVVLGIIGLFFFLIGLLFFLVKTDQPVNKTTVTVYNGPDQWVTGIAMAGRK